MAENSKLYDRGFQIITGINEKLSNWRRNTWAGKLVTLIGSNLNTISINDEQVINASELAISQPVLPAIMEVIFDKSRPVNEAEYERWQDVAWSFFRMGDAKFIDEQGGRRFDLNTFDTNTFRGSFTQLASMSMRYGRLPDSAETLSRIAEADQTMLIGFCGSADIKPFTLNFWNGMIQQLPPSREKTAFEAANQAAEIDSEYWSSQVY